MSQLAKTNRYERGILKKTVFAEARGETLLPGQKGDAQDPQRAVVRVILNRVQLDRDYWGGNTISGVCLKPGQFECWNGRSDIHIPPTEQAVYDKISDLVDSILDGTDERNPVGKADHYNNPDKEGYPPWTKKCERLVKIGNHQFYKGP